MAAPQAAVAPQAARTNGAGRGLLAAAGVLYATGTFGSNIAPAWIEDRPEVVLALSSRNRNLLLAVPNTDVIPFAVIGFARLFVVGIVLYYVGTWFGARFLAWTQTQVGELPAIYRWFQTGIDRAGWAFVIVMPGSNLVCMMAGHRRMSIAHLRAAARPSGSSLKLFVIRLAGDQFKDQLEDVLDFIGKYQWWLVGGLFVLSFLQSGRKMKKGQLPIADGRPARLTHPPAGHVMIARWQPQHSAATPSTRSATCRPSARPPSFTLTKADLSDVTVDDLAGKNVILNIFPSVDTPTCATSVRTFNKLAAEPRQHRRAVRVRRPAVRAEPLLRRRGHRERRDRVGVPQRLRHRLRRRHGRRPDVRPARPRRRRARRSGKVTYTELVPEIANEPNYDAALAALD